MKKTNFNFTILNGVVLVLITAAFFGPAILSAATGPTSDPPTANVTPNFSGLTVTGNIDNHTGNLNTNNLTANGGVTAGPSTFDSVNSYGNVSAGYNLNAGADLTVEGTTTLNGQTNVNGLMYVDANNDGFPEIKALDFNIASLGKYSDGVYLVVENLFGSILLKATTGSGTVTIQANDINLNGPANVSGTLTATRVGSYYQIYRKATSANYTYTSCYSGDFLTSCNGKTTAGSLMYAYPSNNICQVKSTASGTIYARAVCFDPAGTYSGVINDDA